MIKNEEMIIISQKEIAENIFEMVLQGQLVHEITQPDQFLNIKINREDLLLRRPISVADIHREKSQCTIIYRVEGDGTRALSQQISGQTVDVLGPLGNGFPIDRLKKQQKALVIGGGIGVPPLYQLTKELVQKGIEVTIVLGFKNQDAIFYQKNFEQLATHFYLTTDDGSAGQKGNIGLILDLPTIQNTTFNAVYACGAKGMLSTVDQRYEKHPHAYISMESRMACGIGACYACACHVKNEPETTAVKVCDEGPVFKTGKVVII